MQRRSLSEVEADLADMHARATVARRAIQDALADLRKVVAPGKEPEYVRVRGSLVQAYLQLKP